MRKSADWKRRRRGKRDKRWLKARPLILPAFAMFALLGAVIGGTLADIFLGRLLMSFGIILGMALGIGCGGWYVVRAL